MRITEQRFLRGPNLYAATPCLLAVIDLDDASGGLPASVPGLGTRLLALLPDMPPEASFFVGCSGCSYGRRRTGTSVDVRGSTEGQAGESTPALGLGCPLRASG